MSFEKLRIQENKCVLKKINVFKSLNVSSYFSHNIVGLNIAFADVIYTKEKLTPSVDWKVLLGKKLSSEVKQTRKLSESLIEDLALM